MFALNITTLKGQLWSILILFTIVFCSANVQADDLKQKLFDDPTNIEVNLAYLQQQLAGGNFKGAVATLQRVLLLDPRSKLAKVLYAEVQLKLGNRADARLILQQLLADKSLSVEMRLRAQTLSDALEKSEKRLSLAGSTSIAVGSADNALAVPKGPIILFNDTEIANSSGDVAEPFVDFDAMVSLSYKLPTYRKRGLTTGAGLAGRDYIDVNMADSITGFVSFGYNEERSLPWSFNYSAYGTEVSGHPYNAGQQGIFGIGKSLRAGCDLRAKLRVGEIRHFIYLGSSAGKERDSEGVGFTLTYSQPIDGLTFPLLLSTSLGSDKSEAEVDYFSTQSVSAGITARTRLAGINISLTTDFLVTKYDAPNMMISSKIREDERSRASFSLGYILPPQYGALNIDLSAFVADTRSNIPNSTKTLSELKLGIRHNF